MSWFRDAVVGLFKGTFKAWMEDHKDEMEGAVYEALKNALGDDEAASALWLGWAHMKDYLKEQLPDEADVIEDTFSLFAEKVSKALPHEWKYIGGGLEVAVDEVLDALINKLSDL